MDCIILKGTFYTKDRLFTDFVKVYAVNGYADGDSIVKAMYALTQEWHNDIHYYLNDNDEIAEIPEDFITYSPKRFANWLEDNTNLTIEYWNINRLVVLD